MILILPQNLYLTSHVQKYPPDKYGIVNFKEDIAGYVISLIYSIPGRNKELADRVKDGFIPLNAQTLQNQCGRDYLQYLRYLLDTGILETDNHFISSQSSQKTPKSRGFRLSVMYRAQPIICKAISYKPLRNKLLRSLKINSSTEFSHLTKWLGYSSKLNIDLPAALNYLNERRQFLMLNPQHRDEKWKTEIIKGRPTKTSKPKDPVNQFEHAFGNAHSIHQKAIYSLIDDSVGRLHTPLTNIKSELRRFIKHGDETLVSIDLKNSQPYLSNIFFNPNFWSSQKSAKKHANIDFNLIKATFHLLLSNIKPKQLTSTNHTPNNTTSLIILEEMRQSIENEYFINAEVCGEADISKYRNLISDGELYGFLKDQFSVHLGDAFKSKKAVKGIVFTVFFTDNRFQDETKKLFHTLFPMVTRMFEMIKRKNSTLLPRLLQSIESYLFLQVITKKIASKYPYIPLYTIHDSIVTTERYVGTVRKYMIEELTKHIGIAPTLEEEIWCPSKLSNENGKYKFVA